jgi:hypothetical protein
MRLRLLVALLATLSLTGCLQSTALLTVGADGSGTLENHTLMSSAALAQVRQMAATFGGADAKPLDLFSEEQARGIARQMGDSVSLVSSRPLHTATFEGRASVYGFMDITKLRVSQTPNVPGTPAGRGSGGEGAGPVGMTLERTASNTMLLTLHTPGDPLSTVAGQIGGLTRPGSPIPVEQLTMMRPTLAGLRIALRVEPKGRLIRTNSRFVDGATVTLFDIDMDALTTDDEAFSRLAAATTPVELANALKSVPGVRVNADRDITIEFAP